MSGHNETGYIEFDIFPKAKYELWINQQLTYVFVTTKRPEMECIELMVEKVSEHEVKWSRAYEIYKTVKGKRKLIAKGSRTMPLKIFTQ